MSNDPMSPEVAPVDAGANPEPATPSIASAPPQATAEGRVEQALESVDTGVPAPLPDIISGQPAPVTAEVPAFTAESPTVVEARPSTDTPAFSESPTLVENRDPVVVETPRSRVQLNPAGAGEMKAVAMSEATPPVETTPRERELKQEEQGRLVPMPSRDPVEVPRSGSIDTELEAEINAALAGAGSLALGDAPADEGTPAAAPGTGEESLRPGTKRKAKVLSVHGENIILDLGTRDSGMLSTRNFEEGKIPEVGATLDVVVDKHDQAEGLTHVHLAKATVARPAQNWDQIAVDQILDCMVSKVNKGGLEVTVHNIRGFLPASQVDYGFVQNLEQYVGQKIRVKVTEVNPAKRNLVVSRRSFLDIERNERRDELWKTLDVGQVHTGTVKTIKDYGAFVDIGGVDGLLHVGELSWTRVGHPKDVLAVDQKVEVKILSIDREKQKISLGMRQMQGNPWLDVAEKYPTSSLVQGKVTKTTEFGAFVELEPGIEGMIHISELDHRRVPRVTDIVRVGQDVNAQVLTVDVDKKRIALSIKALVAKPQSAKTEKKSDEDLAPSAGSAYERKRRGPLKGGGTGSGGLTFGGGGE